MLTQVLINLGLTRDWAGWLWGRLISGATIVMALYALNGDSTFAGYLTPHELKGLIVLAVVVMWLAGKYDSSTLPGASGAPKAAGPGAGVKVAAWLLPLLLVGGLLTSACAHARHIAVVADASLAQSVFALDDAREAACQQHVLTDAQCTALNPKMRQALVDVRAVTEAIQATPKNVAVPQSLPNLLQDLTDVQAVIAPLASVPQAQTVVTRSQAALTAAIAVVRQFAGGQ